jgi:hypothetical protein
MPRRAQHGFWNKFRRAFRWCRIALLFFVLLVVAGLVYLNQVGLPEFLKTRFVSELHARGVDLNFTRLRLRWYHGVVAENITLGRANDPAGPHLSLAEADLKMDPAALRRLRLHVNSLKLHDGRLSVPLISSNQPPEQFVVNGIMTELRLLPGDRWELDHFQAGCLGAKINLSGTLVNASAVREWQFKGDTNQPPGLWQARLREVVKIARQMRFGRPPQITVEVQGDARAPAGISADVLLRAGGADTAWGKLDKLLLIARLNQAAESQNIGRSELKLQIDNARTSWGSAKLSRLYLRGVQSFANPMPVEATVDWELTEVETPWGRIPQARFTGRSRQSPDGSGLVQSELTLESGVFQSAWLQLRTNRFSVQLVHSADSLLPRRSDWQWQVDGPKSRWGEARHLQLTGRATRVPAPVRPAPPDPSWGWWAALASYAIDWNGQLDGISLTNLFVDKLTFAAHWRAPRLVIQQFHADLFDHQLDAETEVNVATREATSRGGFDFDLHRIEPLLTPDTQRWLSQFSWAEPPKVTSEARAILPAWTNTSPDWRAEVLPTLRLQGAFETRDAAFRGVRVSSGQSHFSFSNAVWRLPDFVATRPDGRVEFALTSDTHSRDFQFQLRAQLDPLALKPLFDEKQTKVFDFVQFHEPPRVEGVVWGQWRHPERIGARARVSATNFVFREVPISELTASVQFTNRFLTATDVRVVSGGPLASASGFGFDLATQTVYLTNAFSTLDPKLVTHAIGPQTERTLSPYAFLVPPTAHVNGWVEVRRGKHSDLRFELSGGPFHYWKFNVPHVSGAVRWADETVTITNLQADFYRGKLVANMFFDCTVPREADFNLHTRVTNADLHQLMSDLSSPTNRLEGILSGELTVTKANTADWESWNGLGNVKLHDGFLWDMPLFGIFSAALNAVIPGLGSSRVSGGTATFTLTNSVIHTEDMEIRSPAMRLAYRGAIDFKGRVDARVEARLLRDAWVIGPLVSLVLSPLTKLFEYKVTGTLQEPRKEPLYIPKPFTFPLHPLKSLRELFSEEKPAAPPPTGKPAQQQ